MKKTVILLNLIILILLDGCIQNNQEDFIPPSLAGTTLQKKVTGEEAATIIARLHSKEVAPLESAIGYYGTEGKPATLYVSTYGSQQKAEEILTDMSDRIGNGSSGFWHHRNFNVKDSKIQMVLGQGQVHYFFVKGNSLYWLAIQADNAHQALAQLLEVRVEDISPRKK